MKECAECYDNSSVVFKASGRHDALASVVDPRYY